MDIEYKITLEDLVQLDLILAKRLTGMSPWIRHLLGICLGPIGIIMLGSLIFDWRSLKSSEGVSGLIITFCFGLWFLCCLVSSVVSSAWCLRWRLRQHLQRNPRLLGIRSLYSTAECLVEMTHNGLEGFAGAEDKPVFLREHVFHILEWKHLDKIQENKSHIVLIAKSGKTIIVPTAEEPPEEVQAFREALSANWQSAKTGTSQPLKKNVWPPAPRLRG